MWQIYKNFMLSSFVLLLFTTFSYSGSTFEDLKSSAQKNQEIVKLGKDILKSIRDGEFNSHKLHLLKTNEKDVPVIITSLAKSASLQNTSSETLVEKWENSAWVNDALHLDTYSDDGTYIEGISKDWNGSAWVNTWKTSFTYVGGNITEMIDQQWIDGDWVNFMKFCWEYDGNGNNTETTIQMWENGDWVDFSQTIDTYDSNQYLIISESNFWNPDSNTWLNPYTSTITTYTNNGSGNPTESLDQMWMGTEWLNSSKSTYSYNGSGLLIEKVTEDWDMTSSVWVESEKDLYYYDDGNQKLTERISQDWDGADWVNDTRSEYTYSENLRSESLRQTWEETEWVNIRLTKYTYDDQNVLTVMLMQNWENNDWVNDSRWTITYDGTAIDDVNPLIPSEMQLSQNYPNPFNPTTAISYQLSAISQVNLTVFNALGQEVATLVNQTQSAGMYSINFDASGFASGVYFYKLHAGSAIQFKKMILMR